MGQKHLISISVLCLVLVQVLFSAAAPNNLNGRADGPTLRIINGTIASATDAKYQVSIRRRFEDSTYFGAGHICGGSLISPSFVLTGTHCFVNMKSDKKELLPARDFIVVMGALDITDRSSNTLVYNINRVEFRNSSFSVLNYIDDLALVFLSGSVPANHPTVKPVRLNRAPMAAGTMCLVTGWGKTEEEERPLELRRLSVPLISDYACKHETTFDDVIYPGMICAGYMEGGKDTCQGDSGGPLVCQGLLVGVISWSKGCAEPNQPGVYSDVQFYAPWIEAQVKAANLSLP